MYGWRGRIGLMIPYDNTVIEPEFNRTVPHGVSVHVIRSTKTDRKDLAEESIELAKGMGHLRASVALYACNASSFMQGREWHDEFLARFQQSTGVPSDTASAAMIRLLQHRGVSRVSLVSPYPQWLLQPLVHFVEECGIAVANAVALGLEPPEINALGPDYTYRVAKQANVSGAEGVLVLATNFRSLEVIGLLERELGKPVISTNQALMWRAKELLGLPQRDNDVPPRPQPDFDWPIVP
jgi:maleate cis-trans isomerase